MPSWSVLAEGDAGVNRLTDTPSDPIPVDIPSDADALVAVLWTDHNNTPRDTEVVFRVDGAPMEEVVEPDPDVVPYIRMYRMANPPTGEVDFDTVNVNSGEAGVTLFQLVAVSGLDSADPFGTVEDYSESAASGDPISFPVSPVEEGGVVYAAGRIWENNASFPWNGDTPFDELTNGQPGPLFGEPTSFWLASGVVENEGPGDTVDVGWTSDGGFHITQQGAITLRPGAEGPPPDPVEGPPLGDGMIGASAIGAGPIGAASVPLQQFILEFARVVGSADAGPWDTFYNRAILADLVGGSASVGAFRTLVSRVLAHGLTSADADIPAFSFLRGRVFEFARVAGSADTGSWATFYNRAILAGLVGGSASVGAFRSLVSRVLAHGLTSADADIPAFSFFRGRVFDFARIDAEGDYPGANLLLHRVLPHGSVSASAEARAATAWDRLLLYDAIQAEAGVGQFDMELVPRATLIFEFDPILGSGSVGGADGLHSRVLRHGVVSGEASVGEIDGAFARTLAYGPVSATGSTGDFFLRHQRVLSHGRVNAEGRAGEILARRSYQLATGPVSAFATLDPMRLLWSKVLRFDRTDASGDLSDWTMGIVLPRFPSGVDGELVTRSTVSGFTIAAVAVDGEVVTLNTVKGSSNTRPLR